MVRSQVEGLWGLEIRYRISSNVSYCPEGFCQECGSSVRRGWMATNECQSFNPGQARGRLSTKWWGTEKKPQFPPHFQPNAGPRWERLKFEWNLELFLCKTAPTFFFKWDYSYDRKWLEELKHFFFSRNQDINWEGGIYHRFHPRQPTDQAWPENGGKSIVSWSCPAPTVQYLGFASNKPVQPWH